jgi:exonuclease SbcC
MQLDRLEISGFMNFRAPAVLDLRLLSPGVTAIIGENGAGKTTWLDAAMACLYGPGMVRGAFPSRDRGSLAEYATAPDAHINALWTLADKQYDVKISVDGVRRNTKAVLSEAHGTYLQPLNDGLVSTFREAVEQRFPSRRQALASAYAPQNKSGSFSALDQKGKLELFSEMLDLAHLEEMGATAKRCAAAVEKAREGLLGRIAALEQELARQPIELYDTALETCAEERAQQQLALAESRYDRQTLEQTLAALQADVRAHVAAAAQRDALTRAIGEKTAALEKLPAAERQAIERAQSERVALDTRRTATLKDLDEREKNNHRLIEQRDAILLQVAEKDALLARIESARADVTRLTEDLACANRAADQLHAAQDQAVLLDTVPFGDKCSEAGCKFVESATAAKARLLTLSAPSGTERLLLATRLGEATAAITAGQSALALYTLAPLAKDLEVAEAKLAGYAEQRAEAERRYAADCDALAHRVDQQLADLKAQRIALEVESGTLTQERVAVLTEVERTAKARTMADVLETDVAQARRAETDAEVALARTEEQRKQLERLRAEAVERAAAVDGLKSQQQAIDDEWLAWRTLAQALGRDGLPKLEIDAAGPTVSDLTNQLLEVGYGTRFTVDLTTQVARADGKGLKEEFALRIFDNTHGGEPRDLSDLSGGERVVVEEALRAGILLFNNMRDQQPIRTCWRDETTGALNIDNVPRYVAMLRKMHTLGGFRHTLFVTHSEAAAELADAVIRVRDGVPTVERA